MRHLVESGDRIRDGDLVDAFLQKYFLYRLEAMSLIGKASESIRMINSLKSLTDVSYSRAFYVSSYSYLPLRPMGIPQHLDFFMMQNALSCKTDQYWKMHLYNSIF